MNFLRNLLGTAALLFVPWLCCAADFSFVQLSDPQFGMYTENRDFVQETANLEFAIANVNRLKPAFVIVSGDLINKAGDPAQTAEYLRITKKLDSSIPIHHVAGNHDVGNEPTPESLALYRRNIGPDYYTFQHGDLGGIVLDSSLIQHPEKAQAEADKQEAWLKSELAKMRSANIRHIVIFQHIPWFLATPDEPDQYFNIPAAIRARYLELLKSSGVHYAFAGHYHRNALGEGGGLQMITTGPVGKPIGPDPSGIRVVTVTADKLESQYYGLGTIPNQITPEPKPAAKP